MALNLLDWGTMKHDVKECDEVHQCEHYRDCVQDPDVCSSWRCNAHQHERNAELDRNNGSAIEYLEEKEVLGKSAELTTLSSMHYHEAI